jgi:hypothetical protein
MTKRQLPNHFHPEAREFYENLEQEFVFDCHERALLREAGTALSISLEAAEFIATEGMIVKARLPCASYTTGARISSRSG